MPKHRNIHTGSLNEQIAKVWLMKQGLEVFENVSVHGLVDLISRNPETGELIQYDVTSGHWFHKIDGTATLNYPKQKDRLQALNIKLLVVDPDHQVIPI